MKKERRKFTAAFKAKVAIEALQEKLTLQEISSKYTIHQNQITTWKKEFLDKSEMIFSREKQEKVDESIQKELYSKIGELQVQVDFLKKVLGK
jgi:transposase-like protein